MASTGMSLNYHYCEGEIVDWGLFSSELECEHEKQVETESCCEVDFHSECHDMGEIHFDEGSCCDTDEATISIESKFDVTSSKAEFTLPQLIILSQIMVPVFCTEQHDFIRLTKESPPILYTSEQSFIQSFLI